MAKGYRILAARYRTPLGEIDLIARKGSVVAFVEVKARRSEMAAVEAVSFQSQKPHSGCERSMACLQKRQATLSQRYDIIAVTPGVCRGILSTRFKLFALLCKLADLVTELSWIRYGPVTQGR